MTAWYKGKVERSIHYIANSFFHPLITRLAMEGIVPDLGLLNAAATLWRQSVANQRVHGTTGEVPAERLVEERRHLLTLAEAAPPLLLPVTARDATPPASAWPRQTLQRSPREYERVIEEACA